MKSTIVLLSLLSLFFNIEIQAQNTLRMTSSQRLDKGQKIEVQGKGYLTMQTDGNLVAYDAANAPKWATGTSGKAATHAIMQTDGNLVIYNNTTPVWASDTWNQANGGYFEIDLNNWSVRIYKANGTLAKELSAPFGNVVVVVSETTTINGTLEITTLGSTPLKFVRQQNWESEMCSALGMTGVAANYAAMTPLHQAIGTFGLNAAEAYFLANNQPNLSPQQAITNLKNEMIAHPVRDALIGLIGAQVMDKLKLNQNDAQSVALREWAVQVYRQIKVDAAIGTLKEYNTWKANPCNYSAAGYEKPQDCYTGKNPYHLMWKTSKPPSDLLAKAGLTYAAGNTNTIVQGVSGALGGIALVSSFAATATGLGISTGIPALTLSNSPMIVTTLFSAFGGQATAAGSAAGAIGATSWAGVVAGPAAIIVVGVTIGISQGIAVIEGEQAEWKFKQAIRAAMAENINMANVVADQNGGALFMIGLVKSAQNGWKAPTLEIEGEVTFFCEAGYVSKFTLTYTLNGQPKSFSTNEMSVGFWQKFTIPAAAKNIEVKGVMISAGEHQIFKETLQRPTYVCYKTYGTVFQKAWNNDWPMSVGGEVSETAGKIKFTHGAGFVANWQITYNLPGKPGQSFNPTGTTFGWNKTYNLPLDATNVRILIQGATGLVWEPWRTTYDLTYPTVPNVCIKIYGTTLDQKWNSDCN